MKRLIAIPLLCFVLMAALSFHVYADAYTSPTFPYPENEISGSCLVEFSASSAAITNVCTGSESISFGKLWTGKFASIPETAEDYYESYGVDVSLYYTLNVFVGGSLYIAVPDGLATTESFDALSTYRDSENDYYVDFGDSWSMNLYTPDPSTNSFTKGTTTGSLKVWFACFDNVPAASYTVLSSTMSNTDDSMCLGVYASQGNAFNDIVNQFVSGSISYTDTIDQLMEFQETLVPADTQEAMLQALEFQNALLELNSFASNSAALKSADLDSKMETTVGQFADGTIDLKTAMDTLSSDFSSGLAGAQTVDEAQAVTAVYQANLKQLEVRNQIRMMIAFDDAISDDELATMNDYYAAEKELVNAFDVAEFDAQLQFDLWFLQMPKEETIEYKKFFDYLMNESDIKYFITIPLAMSLVAIIMGTRMRTKGDQGRSNDVSHTWTGENSAYHSSDK